MKYSPGGSTIRVACVTAHAQAYVSIKGKGIGIAPEDQSKLFDRFSGYSLIIQNQLPDLKSDFIYVPKLYNGMKGSWV